MIEETSNFFYPYLSEDFFKKGIAFTESFGLHTNSPDLLSVFLVGIIFVSFLILFNQPWYIRLFAVFLLLHFGKEREAVSLMFCIILHLVFRFVHSSRQDNYYQPSSSNRWYPWVFWVQINTALICFYLDLIHIKIFILAVISTFVFVWFCRFPKMTFHHTVFSQQKLLQIFTIVGVVLFASYLKVPYHIKRWYFIIQEREINFLKYLDKYKNDLRIFPPPAVPNKITSRFESVDDFIAIFLYRHLIQHPISFFYSLASTSTSLLLMWGERVLANLEARYINIMTDKGASVPGSASGFSPWTLFILYLDGGIILLFEFLLQFGTIVHLHGCIGLVILLASVVTSVYSVELLWMAYLKNPPKLKVRENRLTVTLPRNHTHNYINFLMQMHEGAILLSTIVSVALNSWAGHPSNTLSFLLGFNLSSLVNWRLHFLFLFLMAIERRRVRQLCITLYAGFALGNPVLLFNVVYFLCNASPNECCILNQLPAFLRKNNKLLNPYIISYVVIHPS